MKKAFAVIFIVFASQFIFANEIDQLKVELKQSFPKLTEEDLQTAEKFETNKEKTILALYLENEVYFAHKVQKSDKWIFADSAERESLDMIEFKSKNRFSFYYRTEGTSRSETVSTWRLEGQTFRVIGQDSKSFSGWNQGAVISTVNYLTGRLQASSSSAKRKKRSGSCKFEISEFRDQKLSEMNTGAAKEPECKYSIVPEI